MGYDRLNDLAMLTIHAEYVSVIDDFNDKVIERFARLKNRRKSFLYK